MRNAIIIFLALLFTISCHNGKLFRTGSGADPVPVKVMAGELDESLRLQQLKNSEIGIITPVDLDDIETSSSFGRYLQERLMEELFNLGYRLVELRLSKDLPLVSKEGELILTRFRELVSQEKYSPRISAIVIPLSTDLGSVFTGFRRASASSSSFLIKSHWPP